MTDIPSTLAMNQAVAKQNLSHSVMKQSADQAEQLVEILEQATQNAPVSDTHGTKIDMMA